MELRVFVVNEDNSCEIVSEQIKSIQELKNFINFLDETWWYGEIASLDVNEEESEFFIRAVKMNINVTNKATPFQCIEKALSQGQ